MVQDLWVCNGCAQHRKEELGMLKRWITAILLVALALPAQAQQLQGVIFPLGAFHSKAAVRDAARAVRSMLHIPCTYRLSPCIFLNRINAVRLPIHLYSPGFF